jgi:hypothetical protein
MGKKKYFKPLLLEETHFVDTYMFMNKSVVMGDSTDSRDYFTFPIQLYEDMIKELIRIL